MFWRRFSQNACLDAWNVPSLKTVWRLLLSGNALSVEKVTPLSVQIFHAFLIIGLLACVAVKDAQKDVQ